MRLKFEEKEMVRKRKVPGDSIRDLSIPLERTYPLKGSRFHHPKKVTLAELPGIVDLHRFVELLLNDF